MEPDINIEPAARDYLKELLADRGVEAVRVFVVNPGTPGAETCLAYSRAGDEQESDLSVDKGGLRLYLDKASLPYLKDLAIGLQESNGQPQVTIRAPNAKKSRSSQNKNVVFDRDCPAKQVPSGEHQVIPQGAEARITQALGDSYTLLYQGNLYRIDGQDADAIGLEVKGVRFEPPPDGKISEDQVWEALSQVFDPEIPVNIVSLGLVYKMSIDQESDHVDVEMTLTAPGCGMGDVLVDDVKHQLSKVPYVQSSNVELVFDPPWTADMMSEEARLETGVFF